MTPIAEFYDPIRALLGDFNASVQRYEDLSIASVVRTLIRGGRLTYSITGLPSIYSLTPDTLNITPDVSNPNDWILLAFKAARMFVVPNLARYSYQTRAISESFGEQTQVLLALEEQIRDVENGSDGGAMFSSWQSLGSWLAAHTSYRELWNSLVEVHTQAPVYRVDIGPSGITINQP